jgi:hypothetical protein
MDLTTIMEPEGVQALVTSVVSGIVLLGLWLLWRSIKPRLERVLGQTENSHENTEYPNLRDEVTAIRLLTEQNATTLGEAAVVMNRLATTVENDRASSRSETEGVRADVRTLTGRLDLHIAASTAAQRAVAPPTEPT